MNYASMLLHTKYQYVIEENGYLKVYDNVQAEDIVQYLYDNNVIVNEVYGSA